LSIHTPLKPSGLILWVAPEPKSP